MRMRYLLENLKPRPCRIDQAMARSVREGRGLRFSRKDGTFDLNKLFIIWLLLWFCGPVIGPWVFRDNKALQLGNKSARYIGCKHKPYNNDDDDNAKRACVTNFRSR